MFESQEIINNEPIVIKIPCISEWKLSELRYTCKKHKVKGYTKMSREELVQEVEKILIKLKEDKERQYNS